MVVVGFARMRKNMVVTNDLEDRAMGDEIYSAESIPVVFKLLPKMKDDENQLYEITGSIKRVTAHPYGYGMRYLVTLNISSTTVDLKDNVQVDSYFLLGETADSLNGMLEIDTLLENLSRNATFTGTLRHVEAEELAILNPPAYILEIVSINIHHKD